MTSTTPHIHYLVPGGDLAADSQSWHSARHNFFVPLWALSHLFRAKLRDSLRQTQAWALIPSEVWQQKWVVHCQPVSDGQTAFKYLAHYIFRGALSNHRILKLENAQVIFSYRKGDGGKRKTATVSAEEFIRRFL